MFDNELYIRNKQSNSILRLLVSKIYPDNIRVNIPTNSPKTDTNFLRRIGASSIRFVNGHKNIQCLIPKDNMVNLDLFVPRPIKYNKELGKLVQ